MFFRVFLMSGGAMFAIAGIIAAMIFLRINHLSKLVYAPMLVVGAIALALTPIHGHCHFLIVGAIGGSLLAALAIWIAGLIAPFHSDELDLDGTQSFSAIVPVLIVLVIMMLVLVFSAPVLHHNPRLGEFSPSRSSFSEVSECSNEFEA